jgi:hypothetical protein
VNERQPKVFQPSDAADDVARKVRQTGKVHRGLLLPIQTRQYYPVAIGIKSPRSRGHSLLQAAFNVDSEVFGILPLKGAKGSTGIDVG